MVLVAETFHPHGRRTGVEPVDHSPRLRVDHQDFPLFTSDREQPPAVG